MTVREGDHEPSDYDLGFHSPHWMLRALLYYAPRERLWAAISSAINYLVYNEDPRTEVMFDILAQVAANGVYTPVREHDCSEHEGGHPSPLDPTSPREKTGTTVSEDEIDRQVAEFRAQLDGMPPAQHEPDGLSEEAIQEELQKFQEFLRNIVPKPADDAVDSTEEGEDDE